jgi:hypothetical protein
MFLAQLDKVNPTFLHQFLLVILGLLGGAAAAVGIYAALRKRKIEPQPLEVTAATRFTTMEAHGEVLRRLDGHDLDIRAIYEELKDDRSKNEVHASSRSANLHAKIEAVRTELDAKMDRLRVEVSKGFQDTERNIGKLEGLIQKLRDRS